MLVSRLHQEKSVASEKDILLCELQKSYENLLIKYAEAENTIDRMKLGCTRPFKPLDQDITVPQWREIDYVKEDEENGADRDRSSYVTNMSPQEDSAALHTRDDSGLNVKCTSPMGLFSDEEILSSLDSLTSSFTQKAVKLANESFSSGDRENGASNLNNGNTLRREEEDISEMVGRCKGLLLDENDEYIGREVPVEYSKQNGIRDSDNLESRIINSGRGYDNADSLNLESSNLCLESMHGNKKITTSPFNSTKKQRKPSEFRYALVWPLQFEVEDNATYVDRSRLETRSEPLQAVDTKGFASLSPPEMTSERALTEDVTESPLKLDCGRIEASSPKGINKVSKRSGVLKTSLKTSVFAELLDSIEKADTVANEMKKKSEYLKSFLTTQLNSIS